MVSFGSAHFEKNQNGGAPNPKLISKSIFDAIFQTVVMAMEKHIFNHEEQNIN